MSAHSTFEEAVASYALGALDGPDRDAFERHLAGCDLCQRELLEFKQVTTGLSQAVDPEPVPGSLKARTLARALAQSRQQTGGPASPSDERPVEEETSDISVGTIRKENTRRFSLPLAAALLLAAGLGTYAAVLRVQIQTLTQTVRELTGRAETLRTAMDTLRRDSVRLTNMMGVLRAPDTVKVDLRGQTGTPFAMGRAYVSRARGLIFSVDGLPDLNAGRVYQIWLIQQGQAPRSAGVFRVTVAGTYDVAMPLPAAVGVVRGLAVTVEPGPDGSAQGTTPPVLVGLGAE